MSGINLFWYRGNVKINFGDELAPYIIERLSGRKVNRIHVLGKRYGFIKGWAVVMLNWWRSGVCVADALGFLKEKFVHDYIVSVGSIIQFGYSGKAIVWGSGIIDRKDMIQEARFVAVRGKHTWQRIKELGMSPPKALGDPAILLPLIYTPRVIKRNRFGIIPHITHFERFVEYASDDIQIIDFRNGNIEYVINQILECELILSTSLHGVIVPHAYGIPSLWCDCPSVPLKGDNIKFLDYFSAVGIEDYEPLNLENILSSVDLEDIGRIFDEMGMRSLPDPSLLDLRQKQLISSKPF